MSELRLRDMGCGQFEAQFLLRAGSVIETLTPAEIQLSWLGTADTYARGEGACSERIRLGTDCSGRIHDKLPGGVTD